MLLIQIMPALKLIFYSTIKSKIKTVFTW